MSALTFAAFLLLAFAIGYVVVSRLLDGFGGRARPGADAAQDPRAAHHPSGSPGGSRGVPETYEDPETRYARVLGLGLPVTAREIRARYQALLAQHSPDKVGHLAPEVREVAERKTREILEAYAYFRVKYRL